jgi:hypothetical protein
MTFTRNTHLSKIVIAAVLAIAFTAAGFRFLGRSEATTPRVEIVKVVGPLRVAVLGASASAGFGCVLREDKADGEYTAGFKLIDMVRYACPDLEMLTSDLSSPFFFMGPIESGKTSVKRARAFNPDCVVALDFLFWFCYGDDSPTGGRLKSEDERLAKFELGLAQLEQFTVPVIIGTIPDMRRAVGKMLSKAQMPEAATLTKVNERLSAWAKEHPSVTIVALADMQRQLMDDGSLDIGGERLVSTAAAPLLQRDQLHPSAQGLAGIGCAVATAIKQAMGDACANAASCTPSAEATMGRAREKLELVFVPKPASTEEAPAPTPP